MAYPPLTDPIAGMDPLLVEAAGAHVRAYCGWHVAPVVEETLTLDGGGSPTLTLPSLRVVTVASLEVEGTPVEGPEWSAAGFIRGQFPDKLRAVQVTLTHGYETCPAAVLDVVAAVARAASPGGRASSVAVDEARVNYATSPGPVSESGLTRAQRSILDVYRLPFLS